MSNILHLDSIEIYSPDSERISNVMKRVLKFSDTEGKLFSWFTWYRGQIVVKDKRLWDCNIKHPVSRELGRANIAGDLLTRLRARLDADIEKHRHQHTDVEETQYAPTPLHKFVVAVKEASAVNENIHYVQMLRAGHNQAVILSKVMDTIWKHQEKTLDGNAFVTHLDQRDRHLDSARYMEARWKYFQILEN